MRLTFREVALPALFLRRPMCQNVQLCGYVWCCWLCSLLVYFWIPIQLDHHNWYHSSQKLLLYEYEPCSSVEWPKCYAVIGTDVYNFVMGYFLIIMFGKKFCESCCTFLICGTFRICFIHGLVHMWRSPDLLMLTVYLCFYHVLVFS